MHVCIITRRNPGAVAVHVVRTEGLRGLYRGFVSNASRNTPGEMIFFATYEQCRHFVKHSGQVKDDIGSLRLLNIMSSLLLLNVWHLAWARG